MISSLRPVRIATHVSLGQVSVKIAGSAGVEWMSNAFSSGLQNKPLIIQQFHRLFFPFFSFFFFF